MKATLYLSGAFFLLTSCAAMSPKPPVDFRPPELVASEPFFPIVNDPNWASLNSQYSPPPKILLTSVYQTGAGDVAYYLNIVSQDGYPNLTAEMLQCKEKTYTLNAIADLQKHQWQPLDSPKAKKLDLNLNSLTPIRREIYDALCTAVFPQTPAQLKKRLAR